MILGAVHRYPGIYLTAVENPENLSKETVEEGCVTSHRLKWGLNEVDRIAQHVKKGEGKKEASVILKLK